MVEQTNAREKLSDLQLAADKDDVMTKDVEQLSLEKRTPRSQSLAVAIMQNSPMTSFQNTVQSSLRSVDNPSERRALVLHHSVDWLRELLNEWTTLNEENLQESTPTVDVKEANRPESLSESVFIRLDSTLDPATKLSEASSTKPNDRKSHMGSRKPNIQDSPRAGVDEFLAKATWTETVFTNLPATRLPYVDASDEARKLVNTWT